MKLNALIPEISCTDFKTSLKFYIEVLGFTILFQRPEHNFAMLDHQGAQLMIEQYNPSELRAFVAAKLERPFGRGINLQIRTDDVDALYDRAQKSGAPIFLSMEEKWYRADDKELGNRQFIVQDPDGYLLRFFSGSGCASINELVQL